MSLDPKLGKCQAPAAFRGQKAEWNRIQMVQGWNISHHHHPAGRARCAAILPGIEFQIEIQQTRNYCQAASSLLRNFTSTHHILPLNISCPGTAVQCEFENGAIFYRLLWVLAKKVAISISERKLRCFKSSTPDIHPASMHSGRVNFLELEVWLT